MKKWQFLRGGMIALSVVLFFVILASADVIPELLAAKSDADMQLTPEEYRDKLKNGIMGEDAVNAENDGATGANVSLTSSLLSGAKADAGSITGIFKSGNEAAASKSGAEPEASPANELSDEPGEAVAAAPAEPAEVQNAGEKQETEQSEEQNTEQDPAQNTEQNPDLNKDQNTEQNTEQSPENVQLSAENAQLSDANVQLLSNGEPVGQVSDSEAAELAALIQKDTHLVALDENLEEKHIDPSSVVFLSIYTQGTSDPSVAFIQQQLMDLGFMEHAEPTEYYGTVTMAAVKLFQRQNDLKQDGIMGSKSLAMLMNPDAKSYLLKKNMEGDDIKRVQTRLYELGYLGSKSHINGKFDPETEDAVKKLQSANDLSSDGMIGHDTFELLYSGDVIANILSFGDKSELILEAQNRLAELGYLTTKPDGMYGNDTLAAVKLFQSRNDIVVDGYLGPSTREVLNSSSAVPNGLMLGSEGDTVKRVQELLIKYGYLEKGKNTGYFGTQTEAAVKRFQKDNGLSADGEVGMKTMAKLTGSSVSSSSGSSSSGKVSSDMTVSEKVAQFIKVAKSKLGCPYVYGDKGPDSFDCSGFVYWVLNQIGVKQSYITSYGWRTVGKYKKISNYSDLIAGDVIVVEGHVGIIAENGTVIDASSSNGKIVHRTRTSWWPNNFIVGWRIFY